MIKTAFEYFEKYSTADFIEYYITKEDFILAIKEAMKDTVIACAEKVYESDLTTKAQLKSSLLSLLNEIK